MKISARLLQEYLAGKVSPENFERSAFGERNYFTLWLGQGYTISKTTLEPAGLDKDDDYVVFEFSPDPAASRLK